MILSLNNKTVTQIQSEFNAMFPYLRIEVFSLNEKGNKISEKNKLLVLTENKNSSEIEILGAMTVNELQNLLKNKFNLPVQVFRKSGNTWLETRVTEGWTLNKQNQEGFELDPAK